MAEQNKTSNFGVTFHDLIMAGNPFNIPTTRIKIDIDMDIETTIRIMSEGVPGAEKCLHQMLKIQPFLILKLDKLNIRGQQIWQLYKNYFKEDVNSFTLAVVNKSQDMIDWVNFMLPNWPKARR